MTDRLVAITTAPRHACAIDAGGSVWCWTVFPLGGQSNPALVSSSSGLTAPVAEISAGRQHTCALDHDEAGWCWGVGDGGQLGNGKTSNQTEPVRVEYGCSIPDVITQATNLTGTVADIRDDPAEPDGAWLTAPTVGNVALRVDFPDPCTSLEDPQTFRVLVRKNASGGGNPTASLVLYENGVQRTAGNGVTITSATGQLLTLTWSPQLLSDPTGNSVQVGVVGQATTSNPPSSRRTVEVGAVAWGERSPWKSIVLDSVPPSVAMTTPSYGDYLHGATLLAADATDDIGLARVEFLVDGNSIGSTQTAPYELSWDTSGVSDGDHLVTARAVDRAGNSSEDSVGVVVVNDSSVQGRLDIDFETGALSVDDYVRYGLWSVTGAQESLPDRYTGATLLEEQSAWIIGVLSHWEELQPSTKSEIGAYLTPTEEAQSSMGSQEAVADLPDRDCGGLIFQVFNRSFPCRTVIGTYNLSYHIVGDWAVDIEDDDENGVPDVVEEVGANLVAASEFFELIGYTPRGTVDVWFMPTGGGAVSLPGLPNIGIGFSQTPNIVLPNSIARVEYLPSHELFHQYQYEYMRLFHPVFESQVINSVRWWMEATAEWAAHQYTRHIGSGDDDKFRYADGLDHFLATPNKPLTRVDWLGNDKSAYGAFIVAEYLDAEYGRDFIRKTWEEIDTGWSLTDSPDARDAIDRALVEGPGRTLVAVVPEMWRTIYFLDFDDAQVGDGHVDYWREKVLEENEATMGDLVISELPRMARITDKGLAADRVMDLTVGDLKSESFTVDAGGAAVLEIHPDEPEFVTIDIISQGLAIDVDVVALEEYGGNPCAETDVVTSPDGRRFTSSFPFGTDCGYVAVIVAHRNAKGGPLSIDATAQLGDQVDSTISNGLVRLGIHPEGHLNVPGFEPSSGTGTTTVGLRFLPTGADALAPGCHCEGWGIADQLSGASGWANESYGGTHQIQPLAARFEADSAITRTRVGPDQAEPLFVAHSFQPIPGRPNLYEITVDVQNITSVAKGNLGPVHPVYRRVMDWDVEPTAFNEYVTVAAPSGTLPPEILVTTNDGFAHPDPTHAATNLGAVGLFDDFGPTDQGALIDIDLGILAPGELASFTMFYGAASTESIARTALAAVGADLFSLAKPATVEGLAHGEPNTFLWGYRSPTSVPSAAMAAPGQVSQAQPEQQGVNRQHVLPSGG